MKPIRVLVTDDSAFMRSAIRRILSKTGGIEVVDTACNGVDAIAKARTLQPDLITLDIEMPEMDGLTALPQIKRVCSAPVLMVSSLTRAGSEATLTALRLGAADFVAKDQSQVSLKLDALEQQLVSKIRALAHARPPVVKSASSSGESHGRLDSRLESRLREVELVVIGSSTGGPPVLEQLIGGIGEGLRCPIVIAQHMPPIFTEGMADRLDRLCPRPVCHGRPGQSVDPGSIHVAPGGLHTRIYRSGSLLRLRVGPTPSELLYKPSVNELFDSAAAAAGRKLLAIVLTGMGDDGLLGARKVKAAGGLLMAQEHASCVVYGMPKAVVEAGLCDATLTPAQLSATLGKLCEQPAKPVIA